MAQELSIQFSVNAEGAITAFDIVKKKVTETGDAAAAAGTKITEGFQATASALEQARKAAQAYGDENVGAREAMEGVVKLLEGVSSGAKTMTGTLNETTRAVESLSAAGAGVGQALSMDKLVAEVNNALDALKEMNKEVNRLGTEGAKGVGAGAKEAGFTKGWVTYTSENLPAVIQQLAATQAALQQIIESGTLAGTVYEEWLKSTVASLEGVLGKITELDETLTGMKERIGKGELIPAAELSAAKVQFTDISNTIQDARGQLGTFKMNADGLGAAMESVTAKTAVAEPAMEEFSESVEHTENSLEEAVVAAGAFGKAIAIASAIVAGTGVMMVKRAMAIGAGFENMAQKTGVSVETLSAWKIAAEKTDTSIEGLSMGIRQVMMKVDSITKGVRSAEVEFKRLGVTVKDETTGQLKSVEEIMLDMADVFSKMPEGTKKMAMAFDLLGRYGTQLLPFWNKGREGLKKYLDEAERFGVLWSREQADLMDDYQASLLDVKFAAEGVAKTFAVALAPKLIELQTRLSDTIVGIKNWIQAHPELIAQITTLVTKLTVFSVVGTTLIVVFGKVMASWKTITALLSPAKAGIITFIAAVGILIAVLAKFTKTSEDLKEKGPAKEFKDMGEKAVDAATKMEESLDKIEKLWKKHGDTLKTVGETIAVLWAGAKIRTWTGAFVTALGRSSTAFAGVKIAAMGAAKAFGLLAVGVAGGIAAANLLLILRDKLHLSMDRSSHGLTKEKQAWIDFAKAVQEFDGGSAPFGATFEEMSNSIQKAVNTMATEGVAGFDQLKLTVRDKLKELWEEFDYKNTEVIRNIVEGWAGPELRAAITRMVPALEGVEDKYATLKGLVGQVEAAIKSSAKPLPDVVDKVAAFQLKVEELRQSISKMTPEDAELKFRQLKNEITNFLTSIGKDAAAAGDDLEGFEQKVEEMRASMGLMNWKEAEKNFRVLQRAMQEAVEDGADYNRAVWASYEAIIKQGEALQKLAVVYGEELAPEQKKAIADAYAVKEAMDATARSVSALGDTMKLVASMPEKFEEYNRALKRTLEEEGRSVAAAAGQMMDKYSQIIAKVYEAPRHKSEMEQVIENTKKAWADMREDIGKQIQTWQRLYQEKLRDIILYYDEEKRRLLESLELKQLEIEQEIELEKIRRKIATTPTEKLDDLKKELAGTKQYWKEMGESIINSNKNAAIASLKAWNEKYVEPMIDALRYLLSANLKTEEEAVAGAVKNAELTHAKFKNSTQAAFTLLGTMFLSFAQTVEGTIGRIFSVLGALAQSFAQTMAQTTKVTSQQLAEIAMAAGQMLGPLIGGAISGTGTANYGQAGAGVGGIAGAIVGQVLIPIPIIGAMIGSAIGSLLGGIIGGLFATTEGKIKKWAKNVSETLKQMVGEISDATAQAIASDIVKKGWSEAIATLMHLNAIISDVGVNLANIDKLWRKAGELLNVVAKYQGKTAAELAKARRDLLEQYRRGELTFAELKRELQKLTSGAQEFGADAAAELSDAFAALVAGAREIGQEGSSAMIAFIKKVREAGVEVKSLTEYINQQLGVVEADAGSAAQGLYMMAMGMSRGLSELLEKKAFVEEQLKDRLLRGTARTILERELEMVNAELSRIAADRGEQFKNLERQVVSVFNAMIANGATLRETLDSLGPTLDFMLEAYKNLGITGGAAIERLLKIREIQAANWELFDAIEGNLMVLNALGNTANLAQESFDDAIAAAKIYMQQLMDAGLTQGEALAMLAPTLQRIVWYAQQYGFYIDADTRKLIEQANAYGQLQEEGVSVADAILAGFGYLLQYFRVDLPQAFLDAMDKVREYGREAAEDVNREWEENEPWGRPRPGGDSGDSDGSVIRGQTGGVWKVLSPEQKFIAHQGETVTITTAARTANNASQIAELRALVTAMASQPARKTVHANINISTLDADSVEKVVKQKIAPALMELSRDEQYLTHPASVKRF